jgi:sugar phosphate isomerase/epimerase
MDVPRLVGTTWSCPGQPLPQALQTLEEVGFHEVEIWAEGMHLDPRVDPDLGSVTRWLASRHLAIGSVHLPFEVAPDGTADQRAEEWVRLCARTLESARRLGAALAVAHPVLFADDGDDHPRMVDRFVTTAQAIAGQAHAMGIRLAVENMHTMRGPTLRSVAEIRGALSQLTSPAGICLDIGHAVFNGCIDDRLGKEITASGALLVHAHVHDSDSPGRDPHLPPGDGVVDWPAALRAFDSIGYSGRYVLEVRGGDEPLTTLRRARERLLAFHARTHAPG